MRYYRVIIGLILLFAIGSLVLTQDDIQVTDVILVNAEDDTELLSLVDSGEIDLDALGAMSDQVNILAVVEPAEVGSVGFDLNGEVVIENIAPYVLFGDEDGDYTPGSLPPEDYTLTVTPYPEGQAGGEAGEALTVEFTILGDTAEPTEQPEESTPEATTDPTEEAMVTGFTLIDAVEDSDIGPLENGDVLNLNDLPERISFRAEIDGEPGNVSFVLGGQLSYSKTEFGAPYVLYGNSEDDIIGRALVTGRYVLTASPSSNAPDGNFSIRFIVVDEAGNAPGDTEVVCGPLLQEAEDGLLLGAFTTTTDEDASNGESAIVPESSGSANQLPSGNDRAIYCFNIPEAGDYQIIARVLATNSGNNSVWLGVEGETYLWDFDISDSYMEASASSRGDDDPLVFSLEEGEFEITVFLREDGIQIDTIELRPVE